MIQTYRTAIKRVKISAPTKHLLDQDLINGNVLDYGCGYGFDAVSLGFDLYDPYFFPRRPDKKFDTIICNYVLNVVEKKYINWIIKDIESLLNNNGFAFITVRRDIGNTKTQRDVRLNLPILFEKKGNFCIYQTFKT